MTLLVKALAERPVLEKLELSSNKIGDEVSFSSAFPNMCYVSDAVELCCGDGLATCRAPVKSAICRRAKFSWCRSSTR